MKRKMFYGAGRIVFENAKTLRNNLTDEERFLWDVKTIFSRL